MKGKLILCLCFWFWYGPIYANDQLPEAPPESVRSFETPAQKELRKKVEKLEREHYELVQKMDFMHKHVSALERKNKELEDRLDKTSAELHNLYSWAHAFYKWTLDDWNARK